MSSTGRPATQKVRRFVKLAVLIALVPVVAGCGRAQPTRAAPPGYLPIAGAPVEFSFPHKGGNLPVEVRVDASPAGSVGFNVFSDEQWRQVSTGRTGVVPLGVGAAAPEGPAALTWQGSSPSAGIYHVQVFPVSQPASFKIQATGAGAGGSSLGATDTIVVVPGPTALPDQQLATSLQSTRDAQAVRKPAAAAPTRSPTPSASASPQAAGNRLARTGAGNMNVISEDAMEFQFSYPGGNAPVNVLLEAVPPGSVGFSVYTDHQWNMFTNGVLDITPMGKGTVNPLEPGTLFWRGVSSSPDVYHVRVFSWSHPASFWIALGGAGATELVPRSPAAAAP